MTFYRLYLLGTEGHIDCQEFHAVYDQAAAQVAEFVFDGCSDAYQGFEVWNGARRVAIHAKSDPTSSIARGRDIVTKALAISAKANDTISKMDEAIEEIAVTIETALLQTNPKLHDNPRLIARLDAANKSQYGAHAICAAK